MSFGIPVRNGLGVGLLASTFLSSLRIGGRPAMFLNFIGTDSLDSRVTFTRATTATFVGSNGLIQTAAINAPRFDYNPATIAPRGLLIEEQRANITLHSGITAANWTASGGTLANTGKTSPDGTSQMGLFTENTATSVHQMFVTTPPSLFVVGTTYTGSVYLAAGTRRYVVVQCGPNGSNWGVTVDTQTWTISGDFFTGGCAFTSASIVNAGNGIYRVTITGVQNSGGGTQAYLVVGGSLIADALNAGTSYLGNGSTFYAWGAQLEAGAFVTSYIPTVAATVTRSADIATMTGTNFSSWFNQTEGTVVAAYTFGAGVTAAQVVYSISTGAEANRLIGFRPDAISQNYDETGGGNLAFSGAANLGRYTSAVAYRTNDMAGAINGGTVLTDTTLTIVSGKTQLNIGDRATGARSLNGHIRQIAYYNTRLPNTTLQALTT
jgi:hypothetical protein